MNVDLVRRSMAILAAVVIFVSPLLAAIQSREFIGSLHTAEGETFAVRDGRLVLVKPPTGAAANLDGLEPVWSISAPYLVSRGGQWLSRDPQQDGMNRVILTRDKTDSAKWTIEVLTTFKPENPKTGSRDERLMLVGQSGSRFRLGVFDGPRKGWYLAAAADEQADDNARKQSSPRRDAQADGAGPVATRQLTLVQDVRRALIFDYVDTKFEIIHK